MNEYREYKNMIRGWAGAIVVSLLVLGAYVQHPGAMSLVGFILVLTWVMTKLIVGKQG